MLSGEEWRCVPGKPVWGGHKPPSWFSKGRSQGSTPARVWKLCSPLAGLGIFSYSGAPSRVTSSNPLTVAPALRTSRFLVSTSYACGESQCYVCSLPLVLCCCFARLPYAGCGLQAFPQPCLLKTRRGFWFSHLVFSFFPDQDASLELMAQDNGQRICCAPTRTGVQLPRTHVKAEQVWGPPAIPVLHRQRQDPRSKLDS